jgi:rhodanese-related sulfurtransferase
MRRGPPICRRARSGATSRDWTFPEASGFPIPATAPAPVTENYLRNNLARATGGDRAKLLVIYCLRNCWMSWNAAKRILSMGYANVAWYPDGTDGWTDERLPVVQAQPEPGADG